MLISKDQAESAGSLSHAADYLKTLVRHAGSALPGHAIDRLRSEVKS